MFGALDEYLNEEYFYEHQIGELTVGDNEYGICMVAAMTVLATDEYIFAPTTMDIIEIKEYIKKNSEVLDVRQLETAQRLVALSTCKYPDTIDRTVILARIVF